MPKKLAHITIGSEYAKIQYNQLNNLFGNHVEIKTFLYDKININQTIDADLILNSIPSLYPTIKNISKKAKVLTPGTTITNASYEQIMEIPSGTTVFVVNNTFVSTIETINLFYDLGLNHINYIPYSPEIKKIPELNTAITPAETALVPSNVNQIIDIGHRIIDVDTLTEIAIILNLEHLLMKDYFVKQLETIKVARNKLTSQFNNNNALRSQILGLLNVMSDGIIIIDNDGIICSFNEEALSIIGGHYDLLNAKLNDIIPQINYQSIFETGIQTKHNLLEFNAHSISVKVIPVKTAHKTTHAIVIINDFQKKEHTHYELRAQFLNKKHNAKYTFDDILSNDRSFVEIKDLAKKQAQSNASVLIIGESGTGKEMFAQAIHNISKGKNSPFIAVNCAAIPENLLESELFGYEDGAFTGAKKGGKPGYFEIAHNGTIFLDEIGEMKPILQARLLRVIEEREVIRIGGNKIIPIDVRILSATNKNLWQLVEKGEFRQDLFYRLYVLPIILPPLRKRPCDIFLLFDHLKKAIHANFILSPEAKEIIKTYPWYGNIRELRNCVEYLAVLNKEHIDPTDLYKILQAQPEVSQPIPRFDSEVSSFLDTIKFEKENYMFVLQCLYTSYKNKLRIGRRSILRSSQENDIFLTENQIRKILTILEMHHLVILSNGKGGTTITALGIKTLEYLNTRERENLFI